MLFVRNGCSISWKAKVNCFVCQVPWRGRRVSSWSPRRAPLTLVGSSACARAVFCTRGCREHVLGRQEVSVSRFRFQLFFKHWQFVPYFWYLRHLDWTKTTILDHRNEGNYESADWGRWRRPPENTNDA